MSFEGSTAATELGKSCLSVLVQTQGGDKTIFKVKPSASMGTIFAAHAHQKGVALDTYRFMCDGQRFGPEVTPLSLGIEEGSVIDAMLPQQGGVTGSGGRVRMPHNNRVSSSASMQTNSMWKNTIGYDPYAAEGESADKADDPGTSERAQGIMAIAKLSSAADGNAEKSADFAKQVFWGLKRKAPPQGYEILALSSGNESSSSDDDDSGSSSDDDDDDEEAAARRSESKKAKSEARAAEEALAAAKKRAKKQAKKEKKREKKEAKRAKKRDKKAKKSKKSKKSSRSDSD